jgi:ADP-ribosylglycohydrolase
MRVSPSWEYSDGNESARELLLHSSYVTRRDLRGVVAAAAAALLIPRIMNVNLRKQPRYFRGGLHASTLRVIVRGAQMYGRQLLISQN